jgi:hypothetical protein
MPTNSAIGDGSKLPGGGPTRVGVGDRACIFSASAFVYCSSAKHMLTMVETKIGTGCASSLDVRIVKLTTMSHVGHMLQMCRGCVVLMQIGSRRATLIYQSNISICKECAGAGE